MEASNLGNSPPRRSKDLNKNMIFTEVAVVPAAFALLTAIFMFGGRRMQTFDDASHRAAGVLVALFLIGTIILIAHASITTLMNSF